MQRRSMYQPYQPRGQAWKGVNEPQESLTERLLKGALAGLIGGLVGAETKLLAEKVFPPRAPQAESPPVTLAKKAFGAERIEGHETALEGTIHWTFSTLTGGAYGAIAEVMPPASAGYGVPFGAALFTSTHESVLPLLGLEDPPTEVPPKQQVNELITHLIYGLSVEMVRRTVRKRL